MKSKISILLTLLFITCQQNSKYINLKDSIIYTDNKNNIFLKREIYIVSRKNSDKKTAYFDLAIYKDSVVKLKDFIDVNSFYQIKKDSFIDKKYVYIFNNFPNTFPKIDIYDVNEE